MKRLFVFFVFFLATLVGPLGHATIAAAAEREESAIGPVGVRLGIRSGFAVPTGTAFNGSGALSDTIAGYLPLRMDAGIRLGRHLDIGALAQLGVVIPAACPGDMSCSGTDARFGVAVAYHLLPSAVVDPWFGAGVGYEILSVTQSEGSRQLQIVARGVELIDLELGADLGGGPGRRFRAGPVLSTSIGRFTSVALNGTTTRDFDTTLHAWGMLGLRGVYDL